MILDATAGNRTMWQHKNTENIIYIDIEKRLHIKPTIFADNTQTPFKDKTFDTIFYDPPHGLGYGYEPFPRDTRHLSKEERLKISLKYHYYGWAPLTSNTQLIRLIYLAQKEFHRILKPDGLLWLKWNETRKPINRILAYFKEWTELMRLEVHDRTQTAGTHQTYWVCMQKKKGKIEQSDLSQFQLNNDSTHIALKPSNNHSLST